MAAWISEKCFRVDAGRATVDEVDTIIDDASEMLPILSSTRYIRAYAGVRPLISKDSLNDDHSISRGFELLDHAKDGLKNFITIAGGKLTLYRRMAEKASDLVCQRLGTTAACRTQTDSLPDTSHCRWTEPGVSPRFWIKELRSADMLLCECEMVPKSVIDDIIDTLHKQKIKPTLGAISRRSRIGKGPCQGAFCSLWMTAYLSSANCADAKEALDDLRRFSQERWRGQRPVLWNQQLIQAELNEAVHCGFFSFELDSSREAKS